jgi:hypothetical protein
MISPVITRARIQDYNLTTGSYHITKRASTTQAISLIRASLPVVAAEGLRLPLSPRARCARFSTRLSMTSFAIRTAKMTGRIKSISQAMEKRAASNLRELGELRVKA